MSLAFVSIADDDTGASDIAGMLAEAGIEGSVLVLYGDLYSLYRPADSDFLKASVVSAAAQRP